LTVAPRLLDVVDSSLMNAIRTNAVLSIKG
jgi:hypothetical protein